VASREVYLNNCQRVYDIYNIPKKDRGTKYTIHHCLMKSDYKYGLIPNDGKRDNLENLYPLPLEQHNKLHRKLEWMNEDWNGGRQIKKKSKRRFRR